MTPELQVQRIARLTPLGEVLALIDAVAPVAPRMADLDDAVGRVLAEDVHSPTGRPTAARALRDGYAVSAEATTDASPYAPVLLASPHRVDVGEVLPAGADAVAPLDAVAVHDGRCTVLSPVAAGDGVLAVDGDVRAGVTLRRAGQRLRSVDRMALAAVGITSVSVREPRIRLACARPDRDAVLEPAYAFLAHAIAAAGGMAQGLNAQPGPAGDLTAALGEPTADAVIALGGTGSGRSDASVRTLARLGRVEIHGVALSPGETAAFGLMEARPVLLIPGRLDAALAVWLVIGQRLLARLSGCSEEQPAATAKLTRKVASPLGMSEVVPMRLRDGAADPLAFGYWPIAAIAAADGWILVGPGSEGYPADHEVLVRPWP